MDTAFLILTGRCTRRCPFCFYRTGYLSHPVEEMDTEAWLRALERMAKLGARAIIFTGGEPLLRSDAFALIGGAGKLGFSRLLLTNGELLELSAARKLVDLGLEGVTLSVNTRVEAERLDPLADFLREHPSTRVSVITVFHRGNIDDLAALHRWARAKGWGMIFQPAFIPAGSAAEDLSPRRFTSSDWKRVEAVLREWDLSNSSACLGYVLSRYRGGGARPPGCGMGSNAMVVDCDGSVYPCFHRQDLKAGNILTASPALIADRLAKASAELASAPCFGEHCVSLFY